MSVKWAWSQRLTDEVADDDAMLNAFAAHARDEWVASAQKAGYAADITAAHPKVSHLQQEWRWLTDPDTGEQIEQPFRWLLTIEGYVEREGHA